MSAVSLPDWLVAEPKQLALMFADNSSGDIKLKLDSRLGQAPVGTDAVVDAYALHEATAALTQNPGPPERVKTVAVLFAGAYAYPGKIFGIMFDRGFTTDDDKNANSDYTGHTREACAIFLDTIREQRPDKAAFEAETRFTTIHEMGHLFNLQHVSDACFMASSQSDAPYPEATYFKFTDKQRLTLSNCSTSSSVWPGGADFGDTGPFGSADAPPRRGRAGLEDLELRLALPQGAFWPFEPLELDVGLSVAPAAGRGFRVPDRLDPGYEEFRIWVEEPNGERRLYRAPRRYCAFPSRRPIDPHAGFRRDISIFAEAGGFTFRKAGPHRVWAEFMARRGEWLRSNLVEVEVLPADDSDLYRRARSMLAKPAVSRLLYHRRLARGMNVRGLEDFVAAHARWGGVGRVEYGLGRALIAAGARRANAQARDRTARGAEHLRRAIDRDHLGDHQRQRAAELLATLGQA
jgi:hypothetical protein